MVRAIRITIAVVACLASLTVYARAGDPKALTAIAEKLAAEAKYQPQGGVTFCNSFVRDFGTKFLGATPSELEGTANEIHDKIAAAKGWKAYPLKADLKKAFEEAQKAANAGSFVIVSYKNPAGHGHIAVVVPSKEPGGGMVDSGKWMTKVPFIAQAGKSVFDYKALSFGFTVELKNEITIFVKES